MPISITGLFTPSGGADAFNLLLWHDCANHNWAATAAPGIDNDINDYAVALEGYVVGSLWIDTTADKAYVCLDNTNGAAVWTEITGGGAGGAPTDAHYLVGEAHGDLSEEIVVGATPGGELGGTWASPTVDATHSGSVHADYVAKSLFDAQSVLAATADNTPAAVTVAEQRLVGRLTGGNIDDITIGIADDNILQVDQYDAADNDYAKFTAVGIEGRSAAEVKQDLDLEDADINALADTVADGLIATHAADVDAHGGKVSRCIVFSLPGTLAAVVFPPYQLDVGEPGEHGTITFLRATVSCTTVADAGTNTLIVEVDDGPAFASPTELFTIALGTNQEAADYPSAWVTTDNWIRVRCSEITATVKPTNVVVQVFFTEAVW